MINTEKFKMYLIERQLLKSVIDNPSIELDTDYLSDVGEKIYKTILNIVKSGKDVSKIENFLGADGSFDTDIIESIYDSEYDVDQIDSYKSALKAKYIVNRAFQTFQESIDDESTDLDKLYALSDSTEKALDELKSTEEKDYFTFKELLENHIDVVKRRKEGKRVELGDATLDMLLPKIEPGLISVVGYSGSTKSTLISHLALQRLKLRLPTILFNTELSRDALVDGFCSELLMIPYNDICGVNNSDEHIDFNDLIEQLKDMIIHSEKYTRFALWRKASASVKDVKKFCVEMRKEWKIPKNIPIVCEIDLMSMLKEFCTGHSGMSRADSIEIGVNELNSFFLDENIIGIGTVQLKRSEVKGRITDLKDLNKYEPDLNGIKSSGSWEERSRCVLSIFNRKHTLLKCPHDEILEEICPPSIEIKVLKNSFGPVGGVARFKFDDIHKCYDIWSQEDEDLWNEKISDFEYEQNIPEDDNHPYQDENGNWINYDNNEDVTQELGSSYCN